jgi:hypothetical protein
MSYREVDYVGVQQYCQEWLNKYEAKKRELASTPVKTNWWGKPLPLEHLNVQAYNKVKALMSLTKCPASHNRIIYLDAEDCRILFGD